MSPEPHPRPGEPESAPATAPVMSMPSSRSSESPAKPDKSGGILAVFEAEQSPLLGFAISIVRRRAVAEEIVQEVFMQLHCHWDSVDNPRAWLYRSVRNRSYDHLRKDKREEFSEDGGPAGEATTRECDLPVEVVQRLEAAGYLRLQIAELSDDDRQLVELKYFQDLKYREISDRTGLTVGNVGYRLHHILNRLAEQLRQLGIDGITS